MGAEKVWTGDLRRRVGAPVRRFYICAEAGAPAPLIPSWAKCPGGGKGMANACRRHAPPTTHRSIQSKASWGQGYSRLTRYSAIAAMSSGGSREMFICTEPMPPLEMSS
jgi:hypothetical protein